jgi:YHS domain-containing protein
MKTTTSILAIASIALFTASCGEKTETTVEAPAVEALADNYPMKTCPISGEELGSMGEPVIVEHEGTTVKLCCKKCITKFNEDPAKYTAMVKEAAK